MANDSNSIKEFNRLSRINKQVLRNLVINLEKDTVNYYYGNDKYAPLHFYNVEKDNIKKFYGPMCNPTKDYKNISKLVYNYNMGIIMIFHDIETEKRYRAITRFLLKSVNHLELLLYFYILFHDYLILFFW